MRYKIMLVWEKKKLRIKIFLQKIKRLWIKLLIQLKIDKPTTEISSSHGRWCSFCKYYLLRSLDFPCNSCKPSANYFIRKKFKKFNK